MNRFIECCCTDLYECLEAQRGGASRIELCIELEKGGTTPSLELINEVIANVSIPVNILIRHRSGDFIYSENEIKMMAGQIEQIKNAPAGKKVNGFVIGALKKDGGIDTKGVTELIKAIKTPVTTLSPADSSPTSSNPTDSKLVDSNSVTTHYQITFHRAFDRAKEPFKALEEIIELGCDTLLTSGQKESAYIGKELISRLIESANDRIIIMPGCGVRVENIAEIEKVTKAKVFHSSSHGNNGKTDREIVSLLVTSK